MTPISRILFILFAAGCLMSCHSDALLEPELTEYYVINGDTVKLREDKGKRFKPAYRNEIILVGDSTIFPSYRKLIKQPHSKKNEEILKQGIEDPGLKGKPLRVIAMGSSLSSGLGYNNEAIEFSVSNLIANQMGIEFNNPYFDTEDFNGAFSYASTSFNPTGGPIPKFKAANNNLAIEGFEKNGVPILKSVKQGRIDNYVLYGTGQIPNESMEFKRLNSKMNYEQTILSEKFDFLIDVSGHDDYTMKNGIEGYVPNIPIISPGSTAYRNSRLDMYSEIIKRKNIKGVLINTNISTPWLASELISVEEVRNELAKYQKSYLLDNNAKRIYPNSKIDSLLGNRVNMNLKPFISTNENIYGFSTSSSRENLQKYDKPLRSKLSDQLGWAELDLNYIYMQIYLGLYVSHDGIQINYKNIHHESLLMENKLMSIIVANEALKAINAYYGTTFPYISTREYLN
jgi:hypothetical protein